VPWREARGSAAETPHQAPLASLRYAEAFPQLGAELFGAARASGGAAHGRHYMTQPLVELYGSCMVVLKVS
jgi:hypothetical protein